MEQWCPSLGCRVSQKAPGRRKNGSGIYFSFCSVQMESRAYVVSCKHAFKAMSNLHEQPLQTGSQCITPSTYGPAACAAVDHACLAVHDTACMHARWARPTRSPSASACSVAEWAGNCMSYAVHLRRQLDMSLMPILPG